MLFRSLPAASLRERLKLLRNPVAFPALLVTTLWALGGYTMYTYIAPYLGQAARLDGARVGLVLFLWGVCAFVGLFLRGAGQRQDRRKPCHHGRAATHGHSSARTLAGGLAPAC